MAYCKSLMGLFCSDPTSCKIRSEFAVSRVHRLWAVAMSSSNEMKQQQQQRNLPSCCISHEFYKSASKTPNKIAVIQASRRRRGGGSGIGIAGEEFRQIDDSNKQQNAGSDELSEMESSSPSFSYSPDPPVYEGDVCFTFSEILAAVDSLSRRLRFILDGGDDPYLIRPSTGHLPGEHSVNTQRILGIYMVPSVEYIISVLSVIRCGEAFMPLDPSWPEERVLSVICSSTADLVIGCSASFDGSSSHQIDKSHWLFGYDCCAVLLISMKSNLKEYFTSPHLRWPCEDKRLRSFCYLMYTSGSTGKPKGVCGTEQGLLNRFLWMQELYPLCGEEILLFKTSISFIDHLQEILGALLTTCTMVIPPFDELKENLYSITEYLQAYSISRLVAVPSLVRALLPTLRSSNIATIQRSLKLLVLSGEILHVSLWDSVKKLFPNTDVLNLYGSTEVSGDCTYFDCKRLLSVLEAEELSSVPIGVPIPNCDVVLVGEDAPKYGEIYVSGLCLATGYFNDDVMPLNAVKLLPNSSFCYSTDKKEGLHYFKTGDFAKQLPDGDLVYLGRNDRTVKVNGQRIALEEIERVLRAHEDVTDAAVIFDSVQGEAAHLEAYIVAKQGHDHVGSLTSSFRGWMVEKLPLTMIPRHFFFVESLPTSSSGKVDYTLLASSRCSILDVCSEMEEIPDNNLLQVTKEAFCDALMVEKVSNNDDFFALGGDSISAAHASHKLRIDMRLLYTFPSPLKLVIALLEQGGLQNQDVKVNVATGVDMKASEVSKPLFINSKASDLNTDKRRGRLFGELDGSNSDYHPNKVLKMNIDLNIDKFKNGGGYPWHCILKQSCSFSRCNKVMFEEEYDINRSFQVTWSHGTGIDKNASMKELWKVHMESCVDASPLIVVRERDVYVYIGAHSHKFLCIKAPSGFVQWEIQLEGRVECSAAILGDFSEVVVGCYQGSIYFVNSMNGSISWTFQTGGEVKSQPVVDKRRHLVWCGSYDHNLYALDYRNYCCVYKLHCGGSIYGSPAINEVQERLYLASTNGCLQALSLKAMPFTELWLQDLGAPIFGSLSINYSNGNVICCLVNGHVVTVDATGSIVWRGITGGPIFAGPCVSRVLYNQVLICSRDGCVYSFEMEKGNLLWKYNLGDPITSSAYVDENLQLISDHSLSSDRLICVCISSGSIILLRIKVDSFKETTPQERHVVQEFARLDLPGDIFSSPVMIGGRIFVGCRDDYVHCAGIEGQIEIKL